jgi:hypothetical protein
LAMLLTRRPSPMSTVRQSATMGSSLQTYGGDGRRVSSSGRARVLFLQLKFISMFAATMLPPISFFFSCGKSPATVSIPVRRQVAPKWRQQSGKDRRPRKKEDVCPPAGGGKEVGFTIPPMSMPLGLLLVSIQPIREAGEQLCPRGSTPGRAERAAGAAVAVRAYR